MVGIDSAERENLGFLRIPDRHPIDRILRLLPAREMALVSLDHTCEAPEFEA